MKRLTMLLLLSLLCGLMGCGPKELSREITAGTEETKELTTELASASSDAVSTDEGNVVEEGTQIFDGEVGQVKLKTSEIERQLTILEKERSQWLKHYKFEDSDGYEDIGYTVADLNQNGQLEMVSYICEGSGIFTHYYVNEVTPEGTMVEWQFNNNHDDGEPGGRLDIGSDMMKLYYDKEKKTYAYLCGNSMGGIGGLLYTPGAIKIKDTAVSEETFGCSQFASGEIEYYDDYDGKAKKITREQYQEMVDKATPQGKRGYAYFRWESESFKKLQNVSEEKLREKLSGCYQGFLIRYKDADESNYNKQIQYLVSQKKEWMKKLPKTIHMDGETIETSYELMAMDLDQNGCMELGISYRDKLLVFEVNEDADGMTEWNCTGEKTNFSLAQAYHSTRDDKIHFVYFIEDYEGNDIYKTRLTDTVLLEGEVKTELVSLADETEDYDTEVISTSYYNGKNEKITKQEYLDIEKTFYKDLKPMKLYVQSIISPDGYNFHFKSLNKITDEELGDKLQEAIECFYIG